MRVLNPQTHRYWDWLHDVKWNIYRSGDVWKVQTFYVVFLFTSFIASIWKAAAVAPHPGWRARRGPSVGLSWVAPGRGGWTSLLGPLTWTPLLGTLPWTPTPWLDALLRVPVEPSSPLIEAHCCLLSIVDFSQNHHLLENKLSCSSLTTQNLAKCPAHSNSATIV